MLHCTWCGKRFLAVFSAIAWYFQAKFYRHRPI